jgi:hypothetical protein
VNLHAPSDEKCDNSKGSFYKELEQFCWDILIQNCEQRIFSNRHLGMRVCIRILMIMALE